MNFPLYINLAKDLPSKDLTMKQKEDFLSKTRRIDDKGTELLYVLIRLFEKENTGSNTSDLPYEGKPRKNDLIFDLEKFPVSLKHILYKFLNLHCQRMEEDLNREIKV